MALAATSAARTNRVTVVVINHVMAAAMLVKITVAHLATALWAKNQLVVVLKNLTARLAVVLTIAIKSAQTATRVLHVLLTIAQRLATNLHTMQNVQHEMQSVFLTKIARQHQAVKWMAIAAAIPKIPICNLHAL